jgi:hypothetical protein
VYYFAFAAILLVVWIFLAWMVWKKKRVSRYLKALKTFLLIAGISVIMLIALIGGIVIYANFGPTVMSETAEAILFISFFVLLFILFIATIGGLVIFLIGRRKQAKEIPK